MDGWERDEENQTQERQNQKETTTTTTAAVAAEKLNTWYSLCIYTTGTHQLIIRFQSVTVLTRRIDKGEAYVDMPVTSLLLSERKALIESLKGGLGLPVLPISPPTPFLRTQKSQCSL